MSGKAERDGSGQFRPGQSGNPEGARRRRPKQLQTIDDLYRINLEVAGETVGTIGGKPITRYENALRGLLKGDGTSRLALRDFLHETKTAAHYEEHRRRSAAIRKRGS